MQVEGEEVVYSLWRDIGHTESVPPSSGCKLGGTTPPLERRTAAPRGTTSLLCHLSIPFDARNLRIHLLSLPKDILLHLSQTTVPPESYKQLIRRC